jgi:beta-phosphoglucomutase-like phosphatase (HAD superfamily)
MTPELVIFDCDGVLVDSEGLSVSALLGMIERTGGTVSEDAAYEHFLGKSMKSVREILGRDFGIEISDQHLTAMRVFAFTGGSHAGNPGLKARLASTEPDFIFADMLQLPDLIAGLGARVRAS